METSTSIQSTSTDQRYDLFLKRVGLVLIISAFLGYFALGPIDTNSILGQWFHFDVNQNLLHLLIGLLAVVAGWKGSQMAQRTTAAAIGVLAIVATAYSIYRYDFPAPNALIANIETPWESLFYLIIGLWALWVVLMPAGPVFIKDDKPASL